MNWFGLDSLRQINRLREVLVVLVRYGFGELVQQLRLSRFLPWGRRVRDRSSGRTTAERVRLVCEELGPSFIKIGQILSTRPDLLPPEWIEELSRLQGRVRPIPFADIEAELVAAWGEEGWHRLRAFEHDPIATASIAQVHRGMLPDGTEVAIKVRRPGIEEQVETDLAILQRLSKLAADYIPDLARHDPVRVAEEFSRSFRAEIDLGNEARHIDRFRANFHNDPRVAFPAVQAEYSGQTVLVTEFIPGEPALTPPEVLEGRGYDPRALARVGANAFLKMIIEDGFFHADPHPSNVLFTGPRQVVFIDCGMVGRLRPELRERLLDLLLALIAEDTEAAVAAFLEIGRAPADLDREALVGHAETFIERYHGAALEQIRLGEILMEFVRLLRAHAITLPPDLALLAKALITVEGLGQVLDPDFDMVAEAEPYLNRMARQRYRPDRLAQRFWEDLRQGGQEVHGIYREARGALRSLSSGVRVQLELQHLQRFEQELDRASNRIAFALVVAALIVGSSTLVQSQIGPTLYGYPMLGVIGFGVATFFALWLLWAIMRSGRM